MAVMEVVEDLKLEWEWHDDAETVEERTLVTNKRVFITQQIFTLQSCYNKVAINFTCNVPFGT